MSKREQIQVCFNKINSFCETYNYNAETKKLLNKFLGNYLNIRRTPTSLEMDLKLEKLYELSNSNNQTAQQIIKKALENGWASFYPIYSNTKQVDNIPKTFTPKDKREIVLVDEEF